MYIVHHQEEHSSCRVLKLFFHGMLCLVLFLQDNYSYFKEHTALCHFCAPESQPLFHTITFTWVFCAGQPNDPQSKRKGVHTLRGTRGAFLAFIQFFASWGPPSVVLPAATPTWMSGHIMLGATLALCCAPHLEFLLSPSLSKALLPHLHDRPEQFSCALAGTFLSVDLVY
jgi:hypothetical protein